MTDEQGAPVVPEEAETRAPHRPERAEIGLALVLIGAIVFVVTALAFGPSISRSIVLFLTPPVTAVAALVWWPVARAAPLRAKLIGLALVAVAALLLGVLSIGSVKAFALMWGLPATIAAMLVVYVLTRPLPGAGRALAVVLAMAAAVAPWPLLRSDGAAGQLLPSLAWSWNFAPERIIDAPVEATSPALERPVVVTERDWPGFRGPRRDGVVPAAAGAGVDLDWQERPPRELWRVPVGRGWSSFAIVGDLAWTQEQSVERELVVCFDAATGERQWVHAEDERFEEYAGGVGPRATPIVHDGRVYALGATGILNCLDARTGEQRWSADVAGGTDRAPEWGFSSSPLIVGDLVYVSPAGVRGVRMVAFDAETGERVWHASGTAAGYASPHVGRLAGTDQILLLDDAGLVGYDPRDGAVLWDYDWRTMNPKVNQPAAIGDDTVLLGMGYGKGMRSLRVSRGEDGWAVTERWLSRRTNPKFNDFIVQDGHVYALDEGILACLELETGTRAWKGGRYGYGQMLLLAGTLVIITESGELVLVEATPAEHRETARLQALTGKTWNHPAFAHGRLLVRNASEAVCYEIGAAAGSARSP